MSDPLTEVRFLTQMLIDSERTIICSPELESRIKSLIDAYGVGGTYKVQVERWMSDDTVYVLDHHAVEASQRQLFQTWKPSV